MSKKRKKGVAQQKKGSKDPITVMPNGATIVGLISIEEPFRAGEVLHRPSRARFVGRGKRWHVYNRDGWKCCSCGSNQKLTVDHIIPWRYSRDSSMKNLQTLCWRCNNKKGSNVLY